MPSFVNEKCIPAALPALCLPRQDLMKKLQLASSNRFIYIGSPAGSGKTVSALLWNAASKRKSLWISLDAYDNVPSVFYKLLSAVLYSTQPDNKNMRSILADTAFSSSPVEYTIRLMAEMQVDDSSYTLTLDDLHLINNPDIIKSLPVVLKRLSNSFSVLFLSRNEVPEPLRILFRDENKALIDPKALRFSEEELKTYFQNLGRTLSNDEAGFALMVTGGLAIGINAIAKSVHLTWPQVKSGNQEYMFANYIREQLWDTWDKDLREFMLKTSVVDEMNAELAATLTGRKDAAKLLSQLCASNTFVSQIGQNLFRYHHLFLAFLRDMAKESGMKLNELYNAAAKYYLNAEQYLIARHYAVQSGNDKMILQVIYQFNQYTNPTLDEYAAYAKIFTNDVLPKGICDRYPYLYTTIMEGAWISGDSQTVEYAWDKLRHYLPVIALKYPKMLETVILELATDYRKPFPQLIDEFNKLPPILRLKKQFQVSTFSVQLPFIHRSLRDFSDLSEYADRGMIGKLDKSFGLLLKNMYKTVMSCFFSSIHLEKNQIDKALIIALQANEEAKTIQSPEIVFAACNHLSAVYFAMGKKVLLKETLAETERYIRHSGAYFLDRNFLAWKTKILLANADKKAAEEWLNNYFITDEEKVPLYKISQYFTTVRACIVLNMGNRAITLLEKIIQFARNYRRPFDIAEALTLKACLEWASGRRAEAAASLEEALLQIQLRRFIRIIADEGAAVVPILKRISTALSAGSGQHEKNVELDRAYVTEVLLAAHKTASLYPGITLHFKKSGKPVKLSRQQKKMLELLAKGYKNPEIARLTGLALPTVKGHLMLAYEKLEVNNSIDALLKARALGILA